MHYLLTYSSLLKQACFLLITLCFSATAYGQLTDPEIEVIKNGDEYYWGEACTQNQNESDSFAKDQLLSQIAVNVESSFRNKTSEDISGNQGEYKQEVESIVKTYSTAQLTNLRRHADRTDCGIYVFQYIKKAEVNEIYEERKQLVKDIFDRAEDFEEDQNYANALKYYYFSIVLLNSIPEKRLMHKGNNLYLEPNIRIPNILQSVSFEVVADEMITDKEREITLGTYVNGKRARTLDFSFWDGSNSVSAKSVDGVATINLYGASTQFKDLRIDVKVQYYENRTEIKEVGDLWSLVQRPNFTTNHAIEVDLSSPVIQRTAVPEEQVGGITDASSITEIDSAEKVRIKSATDSFTLNTFLEDLRASNQDEEIEEIPAATKEELKEIVPEHLKDLQAYFNTNEEVPSWKEDEFLDNKLQNLEEFNNLSVSNKTTKSDINKTLDGWEFRQLTTTASYPSVNMQSKEYLVPDFDSTGQLTDVNFGIMDGMYEEFRRQSKYGKDWDKRQVMIKFVEKYRTAYMTRNVDQLGTMFAEQAVIITGRVLKVDQDDNTQYPYEQNQKQQPDVEYLKETKEEFISRQRVLFETKPDIHLGFSTFKIIRKNNQEGIYGISMRQSYTSTNYSDEGYLFLLIDFNDDEPKIYVRAWQPQEWSDDALVELGNFKVNF